MAVAKVGEDGRVVVTYAEMRQETREGVVEKTVMQTEQRTRTVERNGAQVTENYTVQVPVTMQETMLYTITVPYFVTTASDAAQVKAADVSGKAVAVRDVAARLKSATPVLFTSGPPLPDYYKLVFKPNTLVLTVPPQGMVMPLPSAPGEEPQQPEPPPAAAEPSSPPPDVVFVGFGTGDTFDVRRFNEYRYSQKMKTGGGEGADAQTVDVAITNRTSNIAHLRADVVEVSTADGKDVDVEALRQTLTKEGAAVASMDGKPVDPIWLGALKPTTLVIDGPEPDFGPGGYGGHGGYEAGGAYLPSTAPVTPAAPAAPQSVEPQAIPQTKTGEASGAETAQVEPTADERAIIEGTNAERKKAALKPLKVDPALSRAARAHAEAMAKANELNHMLHGKTMDDRLAAVDFEFLQAGENIAQGARTPAEAVSDWMNSPGRKANILTAGYERTGVGVATSAAGERFWCQVFGTPWEQPAAPAAVPVTAP
jgi:uncharacterized protein YkwD